jgi:hypothetical protein
MIGDDGADVSRFSDVNGGEVGGGGGGGSGRKVFLPRIRGM